LSKRDKRKRIEGADFAVSGIYGVQMLEHTGISLGAVGMRQFGFIAEEGRGCSDEPFLARTDGMNFLRLLDVFAAFLQSLVLRKIPKLVIPGHGFAPVSHGAFRVASGGVRERLLGLLVLEG